MFLFLWFCQELKIRKSPGCLHSFVVCKIQFRPLFFARKCKKILRKLHLIIISCVIEPFACCVVLFCLFTFLFTFYPVPEIVLLQQQRTDLFRFLAVESETKRVELWVGLDLPVSNETPFGNPVFVYVYVCFVYSFVYILCYSPPWVTASFERHPHIPAFSFFILLIFITKSIGKQILRYLDLKYLIKIGYFLFIFLEPTATLTTARDVKLIYKTHLK